MKKLMMGIMTMAFALTLGVAYAGQSVTIDNGVTDFTGHTYDSLPLTVPRANIVPSIEGSSAGGLRAEDPAVVLHNGITDFTGRTYDSLPVAPAASAIHSSSVEGSSAGGMRAEAPRQNWAGKESSVRNFDNFEIELTR